MSTPEPVIAANENTAQVRAEAAHRLSQPSKITLFLIAACTILTFALVSLWLKIGHIQETLARQSADSNAAALEARALAKAAQDSSKDLATRQNLLETRLAEVALQRGQLEALMQSLAHSRDENLLVDLESALRLAQQQANLTGSIEPLLAAFKSAEQRIAKAAQPRLLPLQRAISKDLERIKKANLTDTPSMLARLDELLRVAEDLPIVNASRKTVSAPNRASAEPENPPSSNSTRAWPLWLRQALQSAEHRLSELLRVSRIDVPDAALLSPEQSFFVRENLKLKLLHARLSLLGRHFDNSNAEMKTATELLTKYFDASSPAQAQALAQLSQLQTQLKNAEQPRIDDTLLAINTLAATSMNNLGNQGGVSSVGSK